MFKFNRFLTTFLLLAFLSLFISPVLYAASEEELQQAYQAAVNDAETAEADEISLNLIVITEDNNNLVWSGESGNKKVLMTTWTSWDGYDGMVGKTIRMTQYIQARTNGAKGNVTMGIYETTRDIWVTAVPELQKFCQQNQIPANDLDLRLEQLIGLPPHDGNTRFVEFWVSPADLFRPTPDPDITNNAATLDFPPAVSEEHQQWFNQLKASSYGENGYPWTRLGYTYDWGKTDNHIGMSEFIICIGAEVDIYSVTLTDDYCVHTSHVSHWSLY